MKRRSSDFWKARFDEQEKLGISAAEYCRRRSLDRGTFLRWRRRITEEIADKGLVEITRTRTRGGSRDLAALSIRLGNGTLLRFLDLPDADTVTRLVSAIRAASAT